MSFIKIALDHSPDPDTITALDDYSYQCDQKKITKCL